MERLHLIDAERVWLANLRAAAHSWRVGECATSLKLQAEALAYADQLDTTWGLLWSCTQLGTCRALMGETEQARHVLVRAANVAVAHGQAVVAGVCATIEALCAMFPDGCVLPGDAQRSLCSLQHGLMEYLYFNRLPLADVCWQVGVERDLQPWAGSASNQAHAEPPSDVRVMFLGNFCIHIADRPLTNLPIGRVGALLKYLLVNHGRLVHGDVLLELFWPEVDPAVSRNRFHYTMHYLRRALANTVGGAGHLQIICSEGRYGFPLDQPIWIDIQRFKQLIATGKQAEQYGWAAQAMVAYREALSLYQEEFLVEDRYDDWTCEIRAALSEARLDTLDRLSRLNMAYGDYSLATEYCSQLLALDNCREDIHQRLIYCYAALGERTQALRQYDRCVRALQDELGLGPLPETIKLYQQIKNTSDLLTDAPLSKRLAEAFAGA
jgi:DNA-binding SARP family transcriptional activator